MADPAFDHIETARLVIRRFDPADAPAFAAYRDDPNVARYQSWQVPYPLEAAQEFIAGLATAHPDTAGDWFQFAVVDKESGALAGDLAAGSHDEGRQAEIGFTLAPAFQGRGLATEAVTALLEYLFVARDKHRVQAGCDDRNTASAALLDRVGFRREGLMIESYWDGSTWTNDLRFGLLQREWRAQRRA